MRPSGPATAANRSRGVGMLVSVVQLLAPAAYASTVPIVVNVEALKPPIAYRRPSEPWTNARPSRLVGIAGVEDQAPLLVEYASTVLTMANAVSPPAA